MTTNFNDSKKPRPDRSELIDWFSEGEQRIIEIGDVQVTIRFVGRRGRRGRISIAGPAGCQFRNPDGEPE